jgi:hypothetical protein
MQKSVCTKAQPNQVQLQFGTVIQRDELYICECSSNPVQNAIFGSGGPESFKAASSDVESKTNGPSLFRALYDIRMENDMKYPQSTQTSSRCPPPQMQQLSALGYHACRQGHPHDLGNHTCMNNHFGGSDRAGRPAAESEGSPKDKALWHHPGLRS